MSDIFYQMRWFVALRKFDFGRRHVMHEMRRDGAVWGGYFRTTIVMVQARGRLTTGDFISAINLSVRAKLIV